MSIVADGIDIADTAVGMLDALTAVEQDPSNSEARQALGDAAVGFGSDVAGALSES
jgi:hypothetical protein